MEFLSKLFHHHRHPTPPDTLQHRIEEAFLVLRKDISHMADVSEGQFQSDLNALQALVGQLVTFTQTQAATIASLEAQVAAGSPVTLAQLDALDAEVQSISAAAQAALPAPPTPPAAS